MSDDDKLPLALREFVKWLRSIPAHERRDAIYEIHQHFCEHCMIEFSDTKYWCYCMRDD